MFSLRKDIHGRLVIGSMGSIVKGMEKMSERWAVRNLRRLYPELGEINIENAWHGNIAMTPNHLLGYINLLTISTPQLDTMDEA